MRTAIVTIVLLAVMMAIGCVQQGPTAQQGNTVEITSSGFSPQVLKIKAGESVTFVNKDTMQHWPASGKHPTHQDYPEEGGCIGSKFDSCGGVKTNESFSFTFTKKGTWEYHDHLNSGLSGTIIVE
ncbi:cupredoxin domain-containing protein [Candidatus Micrarchaeota archaeon]|nr:cupredoxin domain-containing protein [Candidatus Micrarchaeota archaeon]